MHELGEVQRVRATAQHRRGESAERVPSVRLRARLAGDAALVRLAPGDESGHPRGEPRVRETGEVRDGERGVTPARVRLAALVHAIAPRGVVVARAEEPKHGDAVDDGEGAGGGDLGEARRRRVGGREVGHLAGAAAEPAVGVLTEGEELDDVVGEVGGQGLAEEGEGVDDPVAEPASGGVEDDVSGAEVVQGLAEVGDVGVALEDRDVRLPRGGIAGVAARLGQRLGARANGAGVDVARGELELPLRGGSLRGVVQTLHAEAVHGGARGGNRKATDAVRGETRPDAPRARGVHVGVARDERDRTPA